MSSSITIVIVAVLIVLSTSSVMAQLSDANTLLLDGTKFGNSICYSSSSNLRKQTITLTQQPTAAVPILRLSAGPKQVISCIDLIEVQSGTDTSGGLCSSLASLRLCSGPLGSEPLSQTACTSINTVYTQPKATVIGGSLNDDDKEWSIRYDGTAYNDICFPRSVQVLVFAQVEGPGNGSIVLLIVVLVIVFAVLVCIMIYACYRFRRCVSQKNFDRAINVMPDGGANRFSSQGGGGYENDIIIDEDGNEVRVEKKASPDGIDDDQPPGLPQPGYRDIMMDDMANVASSPRNEFAVNDGPNIFRAGPIASIYGSDIQRDHYSVGAEPQQHHQSRGGPPYYGGGSNSRKSLSMYRVLPDVHMNPLPPPAPSTRDNNIRQYRVEPSQQSSLNINNNDTLRDDNLQTDDSRSNANNNNTDRVTICADCGMNVDANDCPQTCEITGKAHF